MRIWKVPPACGVGAALACLVAGCSSTDYAAISCSDLSDDRAAMSGAKRFAQSEANSPEASLTRAGSFIAYSCYGQPNQNYRPMDKVVRGLRGLARGMDAPPPAFNRCYIRPSNDGCGPGQSWPSSCSRRSRASDFEVAVDTERSAALRNAACASLKGFSQRGRLARAAFP